MDWENQNDNINKTFDDAHCKPEWEVNDVELNGRTSREKGINRVARIDNFDDGGYHTDDAAYSNNDNGRVAQVGGIENPAVEEENRHLSQGDHDEIEDAVDIDILPAD